MKTEQILNAVQIAHQADKAKNPGFPDHVCGQVAMIAKPVGELTKAAIDKKYKKSVPDDINNIILEEEAINTIVQCIRFLENLK